MASILFEMVNGQPENPERIDEITRPYGVGQSIANKAKGAVKGLVGGGQYEQGAAEAGEKANSMFIQFKRYIGRKYGKKPSYVTYNDVAAFMTANGMDVSLLGNNKNATFTPKDVAQVFLKAASSMMDDYSDQSTQQPPAQGGQNQGGAPTPTPNAGGAGLQGRLSSLSNSQLQDLMNILSRIQ